MIDWCDKCEEMMQPFLDGTLSDREVHEAERHLETCSWCAKRYRFEERLRHYVRVVRCAFGIASTIFVRVRRMSGATTITVSAEISAARAPTTISRAFAFTRTVPVKGSPAMRRAS